MYKGIQRIHFIGAGGIGMSGIAEVLINLRYTVSGSDQAENANVERLRQLGAVIHLGHHADHVAGVDVVVFSSAISPDNPEMRAARAARIPRVPRAEMLAELMRLKYGVAIAGTHGKTTTTSLVATILAEARMDPTVVNGGIVKAFGSNARLGQGEFLVTEADESDGSFLKLSPTIAVVTNIDPEHMEHYGDFDAVRDAFRAFVEKIPFYGLAVLCHDHPETRALLPALTDRRVTTYGFGEGADLQAVAARQEGVDAHFTVRVIPAPGEPAETLGEIAISPPGRHNIANTLAAIAVARELEIPWETIVTALAGFKGVQRRFDLLLESPELTVIDDYAHHPVEIAATLAAARAGFGLERRLAVVFQPHRYSRVGDHLAAFFACFDRADRVFVDHIYPAGEAPPPDALGADGRGVLIHGVARDSGIPTQPLPIGPDWIEALSAALLPGDVLLFLGAGDISRRAREFAAAQGSTPTLTPHSDAPS